MVDPFTALTSAANLHHLQLEPKLTTQCKKAFRKDMREYEEADEYCPHCDNQYVSTISAGVMCWRLGGKFEIRWLRGYSTG